MIALISGNHKDGKTVSSCTFPKPMLVIDFNGGMLSLKHTKDVKGQLVVTEQEKITVVSLAKNQTSCIEFKTANDKDFKAAAAPAFTFSAPPVWDKYNKIMSDLAIDGCISASIVNETAVGRIGPFRTIVIDALSDMFRLWDELIMSRNNIPSLRIQDYKTLKLALFNQFIPSIKTLNIDYVILINHTVIDKDGLTGQIIEFPVGPSDNAGRQLGQMFDEVWLQKREGTRFVWHTIPFGFFQAGSRLSVPDGIDATYQSLKRAVPNIL